MRLLIVVYIIRVGVIDVFYGVTSCRLFLGHDRTDYLEYEYVKNYLGKASDILDFLTAALILYLFRHYLKKQFDAH